MCAELKNCNTAVAAVISVLQLFERMIYPRCTIIGSKGSCLDHLRVSYFDKHCHTQELNSEYLIKNLQDHPENTITVFSNVIG